MSEGRHPAKASPSALAQILRTLRLSWRLFKDQRVSLFPKLIPIGALIYVLSPIDMLPDLILGLGQLDDLGVIVLGLALFIEMCPRPIVEEHRRALAGEASGGLSNADVIDGSYHVVADEERKAR